MMMTMATRPHWASPTKMTTSRQRIHQVGMLRAATHPFWQALKQHNSIPHLGRIAAAAPLTACLTRLAAGCLFPLSSDFADGDHIRTHPPHLHVRHHFRYLFSSIALVAADLQRLGTHPQAPLLQRFPGATVLAALGEPVHERRLVLSVRAWSHPHILP